MNGYFSTKLKLIVCVLSAVKWFEVLGSPNVPLSELYSLEQLYNSTNGVNWNWFADPGSIVTQENIWNFTADANPCLNNWVGLTCSCSVTKCNIVQIQLTQMELNGTIPESIGNFPLLNRLVMNLNSLHGKVPSNLYNLAQVNYLNIEENDLTGTISNDLGKLTLLTNLYLSDNFFYGFIPTTVKYLTSMLYFDLNNNMLSGSIPEEIYQMTTMLTLQLSFNNLNGTISPSIGNLKLMTSCDLSTNELSGSIPKEFGQIGNQANNDFTSVLLLSNKLTGSIPKEMMYLRLIQMDYQYNFLTGTIPSLINMTNSLADIHFAGNYFSGTVPVELNNCTDLVQIDVSDNMFMGEIDISSLRFLNLYNVSYNQLSGEIPDICRLVLITNYILNNNQFTGTLTPCVGNFSKLTDIYINNNYLDGVFPGSFGQYKNLEFLYANDNIMSGKLPDISIMTVLQSFYVQNNKLSGPVSLYINSTQQSLSFIDISNNELTGPLPVDMFTSALPLQSFAAASNCITGTLPTEFCNLPYLLFLDLDGLSTAKSCRRNIFPSISAIKTFVIEDKVIGGVPPCLFNLSTLQTLHLSGNEIQWKFPEDLTIGESLSELSLSHNKIHGTIPDAINNKRWSSLDLSYNKFSGVISPHINVTSNSTLTLQVNRLSGDVPSAVVDMQSINILNGNLFDCGFVRSELPVHDKSYLIYQCGSVSFEQSLIIWSVFIGLIVIAACIVALYLYLNSSSFDELSIVIYAKLCVSSLISYHNKLTVPHYKMTDFCDLLAMFRKVVLNLTLLLCCVGIPLYALLSVYFKALDNSYAWIISAAYLSGTAPALILFSVLVVWLILLFAIRKQVKHNQTEVKNNANTSDILRSFALAAVNLLNSIVMIAVNGGYVYVIITYSTKIIFLAQVGIAFFKLIWNDFAVRLMIKMTRRLLGTGELDSTANTAAEMPTMTFIVLFNTIIAPCLATAAIDPSCFVTAFVQPSSVVSYFPSFACTIAEIRLGECNIHTASETLLQISYDPPFIYNYQCTSAILTNYASVYVYMFLMVAFIKPIVMVLTEKFHKEVPRGSVLYILVDNAMYNLLKPARFVDLSGDEALFKKERFILRLIGKFAVFLTFGVVFPPIAVVLCVAFYSETYLNEIILGRFLCSIEDETQCIQFAERLSKDCEGSMELLLVPLVHLVVPFAAFFYAFFIFDIYGDQVGWTNCLWAAVLMTFMPFIIWCAHFVFQLVWNNGMSKKENGIENVNSGLLDVEMKNVMHDNKDKDGCDVK